MTAPPPWVKVTPPADPNVTVGPTIYADDPPGMVAFLTTDDRPWHQAADGGCYVPDEDEAWEATRCRHCSGTGIWSDEDSQMACPYCGATGEGDPD